MRDFLSIGICFIEGRKLLLLCGGFFLIGWVMRMMKFGRGLCRLFVIWRRISG